MSVYWAFKNSRCLAFWKKDNRLKILLLRLGHFHAAPSVFKFESEARTTNHNINSLPKGHLLDHLDLVRLCSQLINLHVFRRPVELPRIPLDKGSLLSDLTHLMHCNSNRGYDAWHAFYPCVSLTALCTKHHPERLQLFHLVAYNQCRNTRVDWGLATALAVLEGG